MKYTHSLLRRIGLFALVMLVIPVMSSAQEDGWIQLFNGENLDNWEIRSGEATYKIDGASVLGTTKAGSPNTFLITKDTYKDFELTFEVFLHDNELNSGVQIRSKLRDGEYGGRVYGPQVEIEASPGQSGYIYGEAAGGWQSPEPESDDEDVNQHSYFKNGQWNHYRVRAEGRQIQTWINGNKVADLKYDKERYQDNPEGFIGLQVHGVGDRGPFQVRWRSLYLKPL